MRLALGDSRWIGTTEFLALERECAAQAAKIAEKDAYINTLKAIMVEQDKRLGRYENEDGPNLHLQCLRNEKVFQAKIAALEAEVERLIQAKKVMDALIIVSNNQTKKAEDDLAPFVALARATQDYIHLPSPEECNVPDTCQSVHMALAHPSVQRAVKDT